MHLYIIWTCKTVLEISRSERSDTSATQSRKNITQLGRWWYLCNLLRQTWAHTHKCSGGSWRELWGQNSGSNVKIDLIEEQYKNHTINWAFALLGNHLLTLWKLCYYFSYQRWLSLGTQPWIYFLQIYLASLKPFFFKDFFAKAECKILHPQKWSNGEIKTWHENKSPLSFSLPCLLGVASRCPHAVRHRHCSPDHLTVSCCCVNLVHRYS